MKFLKKITYWFLHPELIHHQIRCLYWRRRLRAGRFLSVNGRIVIGEPKRVIIGHHVSLNEGVFIGGKEMVTIGNWVHISPYVIMNTGSLDFEKFEHERTHAYKPIVIEDGVWIGNNALLNAGVRLGHHSVIGAGAVVTKDIPPYAVVAGVPARILRMLK